MGRNYTCVENKVHPIFFLSGWAHLDYISIGIDDSDYAGSDAAWWIELYKNASDNTKLCTTQYLEYVLFIK